MNPPGTILIPEPQTHCGHWPVPRPEQKHNCVGLLLSSYETYGRRKTQICSLPKSFKVSMKDQKNVDSKTVFQKVLH